MVRDYLQEQNLAGIALAKQTVSYILEFVIKSEFICHEASMKE